MDLLKEKLGYTYTMRKVINVVLKEGSKAGMDLLKDKLGYTYTMRKVINVVL